MKRTEEMKPCPLCGTMLPYDKWLKVVGIYEAEQRHKKQLELELTKAKEQRQKLEEEYKKIRQKEKKLKIQYAQKIREEKKKIKEVYADLKDKFQKQKEMALKKLEKQKQRELKQARLEGQKAGIEKQKARTERVEKMVERMRKQRDEAIEQAKRLEEMMKKGTTPQSEGLDFEKELANQLKQRFLEDEIKRTGKNGDIIQTVIVENKKVGKIIYECKKTKEFQDSYIKQVQRDRARVIADYGVIVTWASRENKQGFWVEQDIIIVHPYGVLDVATLLRETLVRMYTLKLSKEEVETKRKAILEFIQSEEFRTRIQDSITKSKEAYELLEKEVKTHRNTWKKRFKIYESIYRNTNVIKNTVKYVLLYGKIPEKLPEAKEFLPLPPLIGKTETSNTK